MLYRNVAIKYTTISNYDTSNEISEENIAFWKTIEFDSFGSSVIWSCGKNVDSEKAF